MSPDLFGALNEICAFLAHLVQTGYDAAPALRRTMGRIAIVRWARLRLQLLRRASFPAGRELDIVAKPLCRRRRRAHQAHAHWSDGLHRAALSSAAAGGRDRHR